VENTDVRAKKRDGAKEIRVLADTAHKQANSGQQRSFQVVVQTSCANKVYPKGDTKWLRSSTPTFNR
jgi:hypothetical protein